MASLKGEKEMLTFGLASCWGMDMGAGTNFHQSAISGHFAHPTAGGRTGIQNVWVGRDLTPNSNSLPWAGTLPVQ